MGVKRRFRCDRCGTVVVWQVTVGESPSNWHMADITATDWDSQDVLAACRLHLCPVCWQDFQDRPEDLWTLAAAWAAREWGEEATAALTPAILNPTPEQIERLAEVVHAEWMQEKRRQGWADHPGVYVRDVAIGVGMVVAPLCDRCGSPQPHHPDMVPWSALPDTTKEYERSTVRAVLAALRTVAAEGLRKRKREEMLPLGGPGKEETHDHGAPTE